MITNPIWKFRKWSKDPAAAIYWCGKLIGYIRRGPCLRSELTDGMTLLTAFMPLAGQRIVNKQEGDLTDFVGCLGCIHLNPALLARVHDQAEDVARVPERAATQQHLVHRHRDLPDTCRSTSHVMRLQGGLRAQNCIMGSKEQQALPSLHFTACCLEKHEVCTMHAESITALRDAVLFSDVSPIDKYSQIHARGALSRTLGSHKRDCALPDPSLAWATISNLPWNWCRFAFGGSQESWPRIRITAWLLSCSSPAPMSTGLRIFRLLSPSRFVVLMKQTLQPSSENPAPKCQGDCGGREREHSLCTCPAASCRGRADRLGRARCR